MDLKRSLTYPLRLCPSIRAQAEALAKQDGISLNHFISLAVAEKLSRMEHESWLATRNPPKAMATSQTLRKLAQRTRVVLPAGSAHKVHQPSHAPSA